VLSLRRLSLLLIVAAYALYPHAEPEQNLQAQPQSASGTAFEVATVKPNDSESDPRVLGCHGTDGVIDSGISRISHDGIPLGHCLVKTMPLKFLVAFAYGIPGAQAMTAVSGGGSLELERFDINGKAEQPVRTEQLRSMFRALLIDRFKLRVHEQPKEIDVLNLVVGSKGLKLSRSGERGDCTPNENLGLCFG
jgi:uncharacterized protein (TIGR03435 family)